MKLSDLSIPSGLEQLFYKIFQPAIAGVTDVLQTKKNLANVRVYKYLNDQSLFVRWQGLYDSFSALRRAAWSAYWLTLPFGDHSGGNGWPGSGYSAFVYVNAPRFKLNEDLLLDPPASSNLIVNGNFIGGTDPWVFGDNVFYVEDGYIRLYLSSLLFQNVDVINSHDYNISFDVVVRDLGTYEDLGDTSPQQLSFSFGDQDTADGVYSDVFSTGHYSQTVTMPGGLVSPPFALIIERDFTTENLIDLSNIVLVPV